MPTATESRRERKKQQTREQISDVATQLFFDQGFEATTIAEVARAADVAKMTVTNYFPLKEDLVFDRHAQMSALLADAVTSRAAGTEPAHAIRAAFEALIDASDPTLGHRGRQFHQLIIGSPALLARERAIFALQEERLAQALHDEFATDDADLAPRLQAAALAAVVRVLFHDARRRLLAGESTEQIEAALRAASATLFD